MPDAAVAEWMMPVVQLGSFGVLAWLVLYLFRVSIPKTQENFQQFSDQQRQDFLAEIKSQRTDFKQTLSEMATTHAKVSDSVDDLATTIRERR